MSGRTASHDSAIVAGLILATTGLAFLNAVSLASNLAQTSDTAQGFVVGHAIANGNPRLSGWHFPIDNFYFTDSLLYAAAQWTAGAQPQLVVFVPALVYAVFALLACFVSVSPARPFGRNLEAVAIIALSLAAPAWVGSWNPALMSDMHTATALVALAALLLFSRVIARGLRDPLGPLCAGMAGLLVVFTVASDPFSIIFAFGPAAAVLAMDLVGCAERRNIHLALAVLTAATATGLLLPWAIAQIGGFTTENDVALGFVSFPQWKNNAITVVSGILTLAGANPLDVHDVQSAVRYPIRCAVLAILIVAVITGVLDAFRRKRVPLLDRMLCAGIVVLLIACVPSAQFAKGVKAETMWHGGPPMRFLVPVFVFAAIMSGGRVSAILDSIRNPKWRLRGRGVLVLFAGATLVAGTWWSFSLGERPQWIDRNPALTAAGWLKSHALSQGVGEYWSANLLTAMSGSASTVRSVVPDKRKLVPYIWVEDWRFYVSAPQFAIWREPNQTGVTETLVRSTYRVCSLTNVAGYRIALLSNGGNSMECQPGIRSGQ